MFRNKGDVLQKVIFTSNFYFHLSHQILSKSEVNRGNLLQSYTYLQLSFNQKRAPAFVGWRPRPTPLLVKIRFENYDH